MNDLLLSPAAWQQRLHTFKLAADAGLSDFRPSHWRHPEVRRLLWRIYGLEPLLTGVLVLLILSLFTAEWKYLQLGLVCALTWHWAGALWLGVFHSLAAARLVGMLGGLAAGLSLCGLHMEFPIFLALLFAILGMGLNPALSRPRGEQTPRPPANAGRFAPAGLLILSLLGSALLLWAGYQAGIALAPGDPFAASLLGVCLALGLGLGALRGSWRLTVLGGAGLALAGGAFLASAYLPASGLPQWLIFALGDAALSALLASLLSGLAALPGLWANVPGLARGQRKAHPAILLLGGLYMLLAYYQESPPWMFVLGFAALLTGAGFPLWLPLLLYPLEEAWNYALYWRDRRHPATPPGGRFAWHSVWWHERQYLRRYSLWHYQVWLRQAGGSTDPVPPQEGWLGPLVLLECDTRLLEAADSAAQIGACHDDLAGEYSVHDPHASLLRRFQGFSRDVDAALGQSDSYRQRLLLLEVEERLNHLGMKLRPHKNALARRFLALSAHWRKALLHAVEELAERSLRRKEIQNPYIVGIPLSTKETVFIERPAILARIEKLVQTRQCPPILLYGQRRTGKTSLLHNLYRLMSSRLVFVYLDFQSPRFMTADPALFLAGIAAMVQRALPELPPFRPATGEALVAFDAWLDHVEQALDGRTLLVAMDEFATLEEARRRGQLPEAVLFALLNTLRHVIQHRRDIRVILAGSNTFDELQGWSGYLINAQVVHLGYLTVAEARQLIEHPQANFALHYSAQAVARILEVTRGHPALVQLLCSELVEYKNSRADTRPAQLEDVEAAIGEALHSGGMLFNDLAFNQIDSAALALALELAEQGEGALLPAAAVGNRQVALHQLLKREILEARADSYQFQIEMFRRGMLDAARQSAWPINTKPAQ